MSSVPRAFAPLSDAASGKLPRLLAAGWLLVVLLIGWHQWQFWRAPKLDTDVLALLPRDESQDARQDAAERALRQLSRQAERRVILLVGAADWPQARAAAGRAAAALDRRGAQAELRRSADTAVAAAALDVYRPHRDALLTDAQRRVLADAAADPQRLQALAAQAQARLYGPAAGQPTAWLADPLGLWPAWWSQRLGLTAAQPRDGLLWVHDAAGRREWAVLLYETTGPAFRFDGERRWADALEAAGAAAQAPAAGEGTAARADRAAANPAVHWLAAGIPLHAEAGAVQGNREMNTIGWGSLAAVVALVWLVFRALRPVGLIAASLLIGCAAGLSATVLAFGQVHLLTLVFGASLVGVAEDFGIHYFTSRLGAPHAPRWPLMKRLLPGLFLALLTSVLGYLVLGIVPFPGLRQMALFSAVGLAGAFLTAVCWFPLLDRGRLPGGLLARKVAASLQHWPVLRGWPMGIALALGVALAVPGIGRLQADDDVRQLQSSPPALLQAQAEAGRLLRLPSPAQFFVVHGDSEQAVLEREEALKAAVAHWQAAQPRDEAPATHALPPHGRPAPHDARPAPDPAGVPAQPLALSAVSDWVPSAARQAADRRLSAQVEGAVLAQVGRALGDELQRPAFAAAPLALQAWLDSPASIAVRAQWLGAQPHGQGYASAMLIRGLADRQQAQALKAVGLQVPGVSWADRAADISSLLGRFRVHMSWLLLAGHALVWFALALRFGRRAWRAWLPTALASLACLAVLGWLGEPFQLFSLLALMLLLGMGVDYGIFLLEHPGESQGHAWLAVVLGALSTQLSFGLLALSATPALHAFGLTLLVGLAVVCVLAPCMRLAEPVPAEEAA